MQHSTIAVEQSAFLRRHHHHHECCHYEKNHFCYSTAVTVTAQVRGNCNDEKLNDPFTRCFQFNNNKDGKLAATYVFWTSSKSLTMRLCPSVCCGHLTDLWTNYAISQDCFIVWPFAWLYNQPITSRVNHLSSRLILEVTFVRMLKMSWQPQVFQELILCEWTKFHITARDMISI